jgi:hypothetical protein
MTVEEYKKKYAKKSEEQIQGDCVAWFRRMYPTKRMLLFSSLNGIKLATGAKQGARLKRAGMTAGVADLFLSIPSGELAGLYIEMKTPTGRQQPNQKEFERAVLAEGYGYVMPRSLEEFVLVVNRYLENGDY